MTRIKRVVANVADGLFDEYRYSSDHPLASIKWKWALACCAAAAAAASGFLTRLADQFVHGTAEATHHADLAKIPRTVYPDRGDDVQP